jgi:hypothetical protein
MRTLLTFIGSVIHLVVMVIISPLLLFVYTGLEVATIVRYLRHQGLHLPKFSIVIKIPSVQLPLKRYFLTLWTKAVRFHLQQLLVIIGFHKSN